MPKAACSQCDFFEQCPVQKIKEQYRFEHTAKQRRLAGRRREQDTEVFRERYKIRGGIEGTNSGIKRRTGLGQLRVRGKPRVFQAIYLKITGWNILRASVCAKILEIVQERANAAILRLQLVNFLLKFFGLRLLSDPRTVFPALFRQFAEIPRLQATA